MEVLRMLGDKILGFKPIPDEEGTEILHCWLLPTPQFRFKPIPDEEGTEIDGNTSQARSARHASNRSPMRRGLKFWARCSTGHP